MVKNGIRSKLTWSILSLILLLTLILTFVSYYNMERLVISRSAASLTNDLKDTGRTIVHKIGSMDDAAKTIISDASVQRVLELGAQGGTDKDRAAERNMEKTVVGIQLSRPDIDSIYVYGLDGHILVGEISFPINKSIDLKKIDSRIGPSIEGLIPFEPPAPNTYVPFFKEIRSLSDFRTIGYLQINLKERAVWEVIAEKLSESEGTFVVQNGRGQIISFRSDSYRIEDMEPFLLEKKTGPQGYRLFRTDGERFVLARHEDPVTGWSYDAMLPVRRIVGDIQSIVYLNLMTGLLFGILAIGCSIAIGWSISKPIIEIARSIRKVEHGDFNIQTKYEKDDEIGLLSRAFNKMVNEINRLINEVYRLQLLEKEQEIRTLQAQINPHFLYNAFDSINHLAKQYKAEPVSRMIVALGNLMRSSILKKSETLTLEEELSLVDHYLDIQKIRFGSRLVVHYDINEDALEAKIPKLIIQPVVENAILHGLEHKTGACVIEINVLVAGNSVEIQITDNGSGMTEAKIDAIMSDGLPSEGGGSGIGLRAVNKRLKLIYGEPYGLKIESRAGSFTRVSIRIPFRTERPIGRETG